MTSEFFAGNERVGHGRLAETKSFGKSGSVCTFVDVTMPDSKTAIPRNARLMALIRREDTSALILDECAVVQAFQVSDRKMVLRGTMIGDE